MTTERENLRQHLHYQEQDAQDGMECPMCESEDCEDEDCAGILTCPSCGHLCHGDYHIVEKGRCYDCHKQVQNGERCPVCWATDPDECDCEGDFAHLGAR